MDSAVVLRQKADAAAAAGRCNEAAALYLREAAVYRNHQDLNGARVEEMKAARYMSDLRLFVSPPDSFARPMPPHRLEKFEPLTGCYIGAFIDRDERLGRSFRDENDQTHYDPAIFARATGKKHASVFCYVAYGRPFPTSWVNRLRQQGVAAHIAWEPNRGLDVVQDDDYLRRFAQEAGRAATPVFLRFASEMNGDWTAYGGDPWRYQNAWKTVQQAMARWAPNVAMVWCVNSVPEPTIARFYPGDAYVDWVGVNCYSVPYHDNDPRRDARQENPADLVRYVYANYAHRKPIMICEYGASHRGAADGRDRSAWASRKITEMYAALPRLYPRIKAINIFNMNNMAYAEAGRQLNDYSLTENDELLRAYAEAVRPDHFLTTVGDWNTAPAPLIEQIPGAIVPARFAANGILRVSAWARCHSDWFTLKYLLDGREVYRSAEFGAFDAVIPGVGTGKRTLTALLIDDRGNLAARREYKV